MAKVLQRLALAAVLVGGVTAFAAETAEAARPDRPTGQAARRPARRSFQLFQGATSTSLEVNRVYCGLTDAGSVCTDVTGSPVLGGGSWPRGTPDQYVFGTGIQVAGVIPSTAGFAWAGDTVGAWAVDTRGPAEHMQSLTGLYSSLDADDAANWPSGAYVNDTTLYNAALIGRPSISQQDTWVRYWDGVPSLVTGRSHTMGVLIEQRSLAWNFPTGNEDVIYFLFRFTNITASDPSVYNGLSYYGFSPTDIAEIAGYGAEFQRRSEAAFNVSIPDGGYAIGNVYAAFTADMDVGDATNNYASAVLPFSLAITYKADFQEATWQFPTSIFGSPFAAAPGFVGTKYLKSPVDPATGREFGITIFTTYTNPSAPNSLFPDPLNIFQGYRYLKGDAQPAFGDQPCQYPPARRLCFLGQAPSDQRTMQSSGPFSLAPGQSEVIVVAYVFAAPLASNPGRPSYALGNFIGNTSMVPGVVPSSSRLATGLDTLRNLDAAVGWVSHADTAGGIPDGRIDQNEVTVVSGSLLDKSLVAQAVFDNRFLLPFAPEAPDFYVIPGNNQVTVVWKKSATETVGDPYFAVASDPTSTLYDPNFRQFDVEGYRVWRGRSPANMELIAQFDYAGTVISDYNGNFYNADYNDATTGAYQCAPELVPAITGSCPTFPNDIDIVTGGPAYPGVVQVSAGGRVALGGGAAGTVLITGADTAVTGAASGSFPPLVDGGVPFAYVDNTVRNGYRYFYSVTAFDVNSLESGPTSLSSPLVTQSVIPRVGSGQQTAGSLGQPEFIDHGGNPVQSHPMPTLDRATGQFNGPMAQTDVALGFAAFVPQIVQGTGALSLKVLDVTATSGNAGSGADGTYTFVLQGVAAPDTITWPVHVDPFDTESEYSLAFEAGPASTAQSARYGGDSTYLIYGSLSFAHNSAWRLTGWGRGHINGAPDSSNFNGPRWWDGTANENTPTPNLNHCVGSPGGCVQSPLTNTAGALTGVSTLFHVLAYNTVNSVPQRDLEAALAFYARAADFSVHWGANGVIDSVIDDTHGVVMPFDPTYRASWGILNVASFAGTSAAATADGNNGLLTWSDIHCVAPIPSAGFVGSCGGAAQTPAVLQNTAVLNPIAAVSASYSATSALTATGTGFIFYLNGHNFVMEMAALPAAGTVWHARFYSGTILGGGGDGPYTFLSGPRPMNIPGLEVRISYSGTTFDPTVTTDAAMDRIHTVPDPYYVTSTWEQTTNSKILRFVNLPAQAIIRIYSLSGILVNVITHNDAQAGGDAAWNVRNRNNQFVASGVYFYHVEAPDGRTKVGRFTVVNFGQ